MFNWLVQRDRVNIYKFLYLYGLKNRKKLDKRLENDNDGDSKMNVSKFVFTAYNFANVPFLSKRNLKISKLWVWHLYHVLTHSKYTKILRRRLVDI